MTGPAARAVAPHSSLSVSLKRESPGRPRVPRGSPLCTFWLLASATTSRRTPIPRSKTHATRAGAALLVAAAVIMAMGETPPAFARGVIPHHWTYARPFAPPSTAQCRSRAHLACYAPFQLQRAYDLNSLYGQNLNGTGETIAVIDSFGSPTIRRDLARFNTAFHLPTAPLQIIHPVGAISRYAPSGERISWGFETTLDVEWAHAFAPEAKILLVETPVDRRQSLEGIPQLIAGENYVLNHHMADVISQSFGLAEANFPSRARLQGLRSAAKKALARHVTMIASSGDTGATGYALRGGLFTRRVAHWPTSDPLVTAVGGTQLHLNAVGARISPDTVWNDTFNRFVVGHPPVPSAGGGGLSAVFARPAFQASIHAFSANHRGYPDISLSAAVNGGVLVYLSFGGLRPGFYIAGGTSEAAPEFAGLVAIADQAAGHDLGFIDPSLYQLHQMGSNAFIDVASGNNTVRFRQNKRVRTVAGYKARPGFDLASGLGTVDGLALVQALSGT